MRPEKVSRKTTNLGRLILLPLALLAANTFAQNPVPSIDEPLVPSAVAPGGPDFTLTVNGTGFVTGATVNWNGTPLTTTLVSRAQLTASVPAADIASPGTGWVTVVNPTPGGGTSNAAFLSITTPSSGISLARTDITMSYPLFAIASGDFNNDGKLDFALNTSCSSLAVYAGNGDGTFQTPIPILLTLSSSLGRVCIQSLVVGDFNGDGKADLLLGAGNCLTELCDLYFWTLLGNGDGTFQPPIAGPSGYNYSYSLVVADFNGDGKLDFAEYYGDGFNYFPSIAIFLGNGDGTFQSPSHISVGINGGAQEIVAGDFNGDGKLDLAVSFAGEILVFFGNGDGTFQGPITTSPVNAPYFLAGDFNGDGKLDLVGTGPTGYVSVFLGNGDGTFQAAVPTAVGTGASSLVLADFNGDGNLDIAVANHDSANVSILFGNGDGTFQAQAVFSVPAGPIALFAGDFNGAGRAELLTASDSKVISVLLQVPILTISPPSLSFSAQTVGTNSAPQTLTLSSSGGPSLQIRSIVVGGPGTPDFTQTNDCPGTLVNGASCTVNVGFSPQVTGTIDADLTVSDNAADSPQTAGLGGAGTAAAGLPAVGLSPLALDFGIQNGSTHSTAHVVTVTNTGSAALTVASATLGGADAGEFANVVDSCSGATMAPAATCMLSVTFSPAALGVRTAGISLIDNAPGSPQIVPLSGTGVPNPVPFVNQPLVPDAVAPGGPSFTLTVNGAGFVSGATANWNGTPLTTTFVSSSQLAATVPAANIATRGTTSITVTNPSTSVVSNVVYFPVAPPAPAVAFAVSTFAVQNYPWSVAAGNFNGDVNLDLEVATSCAGAITCDSTSRAATLFLGNGNGTFTSGSSSALTGEAPYSFAVGDFNGDGKQDLAITTAYDSAEVTILLGNGDGTFSSGATYPATGPGGPTFVAAGDFNGDGRLDLAVANQGSIEDGLTGTVTILLGNGDGTFTSAPSSPSTGLGSYFLAVGDFNGDGRLDLAVANVQSNNVTILLGNGDGTFTAAAASPAVTGPGAILAADFNGDGKLDLAVVSGNSLRILLGNGDGTFAPAASNPTTEPGPESIVAGDFNGDGKLDLLVACIRCNPADPTCASLNGGVTILLGNGDGTFAPGTFSLGAGWNPLSMVTGDFNGDGTLDLAVVDTHSSDVSVLLQVPAVRLSSSALTFPDQTLNTTSPAQSLTLIDQGNANLNITAIAVSGDFAIQASGTTCSTSRPVAAGGNCTISITFTPTSLGSRTGTLTVTDDAYNTPQSATLSGDGIDPSAVLSPTSLNFGNQNVATTSAAQPVTLTNSGVGTLTIASITASGDFAQTNNCGISVAQGASCTINVTFTPTTAGARTGALTFNDNAANSPQTVSLTGIGAPPTVTLSATTLTFGSYGIGISSPAQTVTVSNNGPGPVTVTKVTASGDFAQTNDCVGTIAALASCTINVTFTPTAGGTRAGFVTITDDAVASPQTVTLTGTGTPPTATASPASLSFGNVSVGTTTAAQAVTLSNGGPGALSISSIAVTGANHADFPQTNSCPSSLAASASCTINVTFKPSLNAAESGTLTIKDNAASNPQTVSLSGTGQAPVASLSPASLDFPGQTVGVTSAPATVTLTNSGALALSISGILVTSPFLQSNNCPASPATLAPGSSCTITLTFTAAFAGTTFGSLYVSDNALGSGQQTVALTGEAALSFGDQPVGEVSTAQAVTVANGSTTKTVTITGVTATGDFAVASNPCGALPPLASCAPMVTFTPTVPGTRTGALAVKTFTGSTLSVPLTGTGLGPTATLSKSSVAFGSVFVGATSPATSVTVTNNGNQALNFTTIAASGDFSVAASGTTCAVGTAVAAGANCAIRVTFKPTAGGARTGAITLADNASGSPQTVALSGTGEDFTIGPAPGSSLSESVSAGQPATYNLAFSPAGGFTGTATLTCTGAPAGATCTINPASLSLSGTSAADATVTVTTTAKTTALPSWRWDSPTASPRQRFPIPLTWLLFLVTLTLAAGTLNRMQKNLPSLSFRGVRQSGWRTTRNLALKVEEIARARFLASLGMTAPLWALAAVTLAISVWAACGGGRCIYPPPPAAGVSLSATSLTFSNQNMGTTSTAQTVTLTNSGNAALSITGIALAGANSGDFAQTNTCDGAVSAGANCQIKATFAPTASGTRAGSVTIADNATDSPQSISLSGKGVPPVTPAGSYALTVTASSTNGVSHSIALTLTVM